MKNKYAPNTNKRSSIKKLLFIGGGILIVGAVVVAILEATNKTYIFEDKPQPVTASESTKGEPLPGTSDKQNTDQSGKPGTTPGDTSQSPADEPKEQSDNTPTNLLTPSGDFVSNHRPNLSGNPAPNTVTSVCTSTPGASCTITFTKGSTVKSLPAQTTDRGGSTYWNNWKIQDIGLTTGSWQVKAVATLNGQTKEATDATTFEVNN